MWLKEVHVIVFVPRGSQHFAQWWQRCHELHHGFQCICCHEHNVKGGYPYGQWDVCTHIKGCLQLKDGVLQVARKMLWKTLMLWKILGKIIERLGRLVKV